MGHHSDFFDAGYRIISLNPTDKRNPALCLCGIKDCELAGKHPRHKSWQTTPQLTEEQYLRFCERGFFENYGVLLTDKLLVVDVDAKNGGVASMEKMEAEDPELYELIESSGLIVETGSGGGSVHYYFKQPDDCPPLVQILREYPGIDFKSTGFVVGPGSRHKSGNYYRIEDGSPDGITKAPLKLVAKLERPERISTGEHTLTQPELADMVSHIPNNDCHYEDYITVGMALHDATDGEAYELWNAWCSRSDKNREQVNYRKWQSFGRSASPVTIGTIIKMAKDAGWEPPKPEDPFEELRKNKEPVADDNENYLDFPVDITGFDLRRPPGFAGRLAEWIRKNGIRPREYLSAGASLLALNACVGLRHVGRGGLTLNLMGFGVAGSGTGKDAVLEGVRGILEAAGLAQTYYSEIKSEQEMTQNLIRHQVSVYALDEAGLLLEKLKNSSKGSAAHYLSGIIPAILKMFSASNRVYGLSGDKKEELERFFQARVEAATKRADSGKGVEKAEADIEYWQAKRRRLDECGGIDRPYLVLYGTSTPETFDHIMTRDMVESGFLGRALLFVESKGVPPRRKHAKREKLSMGIETKLKSLAWGPATPQSHRVEYDGPRVEIEYTDEANDALDRIVDYFDELSLEQEELTGLQAITLRAAHTVEKVAATLGAADGAVEIRHVTWAFALVYQDVTTKIRMVYANEENTPKAGSLKAKILTKCQNGGQTQGVLTNRLKSKKTGKKEIESAIKKLLSDGMLKQVTEAHPKSGKTYTLLVAV